ncbi:MAG: 16S rRNA (cytosine(967)-C(5))-methyltransferase RsmB [Verrucomicrobiota bacterium]|jgi:16S rRNA (cytosine967-C5)-methyltransferase
MALLKVVSDEKPREIAMRILQRGAGGDFVENRLEAELARTHLSVADRHLCQELAYGIVRWQATLDWLIARKTDARAQKPILQNLLRLGLYQIFWLDRIPDHAAVHETVELARQSGFHLQAGFINAVLRGYLREFDATRRLLAELKTTQPHLGYSHPEWLVARWQTHWGADRAAQLMEWNNTPPQAFARVNTLKADPGKLLAQWRDEEVDYDFVRRDWLEENLVFELKSHPPLSRLPSFQQGLFYVQDPSTLLAVRELDPQPGESVLDLCAAPGGKLAALAQLMRNEGRLLAHDTTPERLKLIEQNCARLGVTCVQTVLPSALDAQPSTTFDRILIDAPCSNTGVMRRRVDLRWRIRPKEIGRLRAAQLELLRQAASLLKRGGLLVYSTCSLEPEENSDVVNEFLGGHADFGLERSHELLPFVQSVDGTYVARMVRGG